MIKKYRTSRRCKRSIFYDNSVSENYPNVIKNKPSRLSRSSFTMEFATLSVPKEVIPYYKTRNILDINLIEGDYPDDDTEDLIIPDFMADELIANGKYIDYENLIDEKLVLPVSIPENEEKGTKAIPTTHKYTISGIYKTDYKNYLEEEYPIYLGHRASGALTQEELKRFYDEDLKWAVNNSEAAISVEYNKSAYESLETYKEAWGTSEQQMAIILKDGYTSKDVYNDIDALYPNIKQQSKYAYRQDENVWNYLTKYIILAVVIFILVIFIIFLLLFVILQGYYRNKIKDYALLLSFGYSKFRLFKMLIIESFVDSILIFILLLIASQLLVLLPLPFKVFTTFSKAMLTSKMIILYIFIIVFISVLNITITILRIKYNRLYKYLK